MRLVAGLSPAYRRFCGRLSVHDSLDCLVRQYSEVCRGFAKSRGATVTPASDARRQRCRTATGSEPGVVPADTRRGEDAAEWGKAPGNGLL
jgi:hypothetical protein